MPDTLNTSDFKEFIETCGQVSYEDAQKYADIGDRINKMAMKISDENAFMEEMLNLENELQQSINPPNPAFSISNMASCLLYAQTRDNFHAGQGYGKGANINQYGDKAQSEIAVRNLMAYFSQEKMGKECGYDAPSTHGRWRQGQLPAGIKDLKLRIDIESDPKTGSIPAPLRGIHTAHFVPGVDGSGITKLLVKPENWGMKKLVHRILHILDFLITRFSSHKIKSLEGRQETKLTKESVVSNELNTMRAELKSSIESLKDKSLQGLFKQVNEQLIEAKSERGFDKPLEKLAGISNKLNDWLNSNPEHEDHRAVYELQEIVVKKIVALQDKQIDKYGSEFQQKSEVRLMYSLDGSSKIDSSGAEMMKMKFQEFRHHPEPQAGEVMQPLQADLPTKRGFTP